MTAIHSAAECVPQLNEAVSQSLQPVTNLLGSLRIERLQLHNKPVKCGEPATDDEIDELWEEMQHVDPTLLRTDTTAAAVREKQQLQAFMQHCVV